MRRTLVLLLLVSPTAADPPLVRLGSDRFRQADRVTALAYTPDGKRLATADEQTIYLWDAADGRPLRAIPGKDRLRFIALRFNKDATGLFAVALNEKKDAALYYFDPASGKEIASADLMGAGKDNFNEPKVAFSPDGAWVAASRGDRREVVVMDTMTRKPAWSEKQADEVFYSLAFRADSAVLAVGGWDGQVRLVDPKAGRVTHQYALAESAIWHVAFSPDGEDLVAAVHAKGDTDVTRFEAGTGKVRWTYPTESAHDLFFNRDGSAVVYFGPARDRRDPYQWHWLDAATGKSLGRSMDTEWQEAALRPDGKVLALGGRLGHVTQWDLTTRKRLDAASADPPGGVVGLEFNPDGKSVRGWTRGGPPGWYEWEVKTGKQTWRMPPADAKSKPFRRLKQLEGPDVVSALSADNSVAVTLKPIADRLHVTRWDVEEDKAVGEWDGRLPDPAMVARSHGWHAQLSPDARLLAVFFSYLAFAGMGFNDIYELHSVLFDARTGRYLSGWYDLHTQADLAFGPDGRTVACFYYGGLGVDVREAATGGRRARRSNPPITAAAFSPDGRTLALATSPGPVALWDWFGKPADKWNDAKPAKLWDVLADEKAEAAFDAIHLLQANPKEAVAFLKERMKVPTAPAADWLAARVKALDAANFKEREQASADLAAAGEVVLPALQSALKGSSAEAHRRLEALLLPPTAPSREMLRAIRSCEVLEGIGTPEARNLLTTWAKGAPAATLTREAAESLERLAKRGK
jgi:WD40 repeat protein